ncbi:hypothetical protein [Actinoallomurus iriomotensis]|uniref:Uncharacterized protein n=1 Tax=Actinoallomurus iriomotensis TaxID=478107 RepID=A0A9W6VYR5_9ACTN|nr:hypothetical protein [Actinoallomurus iriomotensis]GLY83091.1 hypothetical protein Airi02_010210 [Actinoallomurus iriomotensis]
MNDSSVLSAWRSGDGSLSGVLAEDATFSSPVADYEGQPNASHVLGLIAGVLEGVDQTGAWGDEREGVYAFTARVDDREVQGIVREERAETGELTHVTLFLRPYGVLRTAIGRMREALEHSPLPARA